VDDKPPQKNVFKKLRRGQGEKIRWSIYKRVQTVCAFVHFVSMRPLLPTNFKEQAGKNQGFHNHVHNPRDE
jgi:hypothetical protein